MMKYVSRIKHNHFKKILPVIVIVVVAIGGTYLLLSSHAASPAVSVTADSGTPTGLASKVTNCSGATNGSCVLFGPPSGGSGPGTKTDCFKSPGVCGYPDPAAPYDSVGSTTPCSSLPTSAGMTVTTAGATIQNMNLTGGMTVDAPNVTINNVCATASGGSGNMALWVGSNATNLTLEHSTFAGTSSTGNGVIDTGVFNDRDVAGLVAKNIYIYNAAEAWHGSGTVQDSYMQAGATFSGSHNEDIYLSDSSITLTHDTLLNSTGQTAVLFGDNYGGGSTGPATNDWTVTNSLLAGGGWMAYFDARGTSVGKSVMDITNNRWARCLGKAVFDGNGNTCSGVGDGANDGYGYFPDGGYYGGPIDGYCGSGQTWTGNVWDDNNATITCD